MIHSRFVGGREYRHVSRSSPTNGRYDVVYSPCKDVLPGIHGQLSGSKLYIS
jgi:hypothetical protein